MSKSGIQLVPIFKIRFAPGGMVFGIVGGLLVPSYQNQKFLKIQEFIVFYHMTVISYFPQRMPASWLVPTIELSRHRYCGQREEGSSLKTQCRENATHLHLFIRDGRERFFSLGGAGWRAWTRLEFRQKYSEHS